MIDTLKVSPHLGGKDLRRPSISSGAANLYMHGPLEESTRPNLRKVNLSCDLAAFLSLCRGLGTVALSL